MGDSGQGISRRELLKKGLLGAAGIAALPAVVAACGSKAATPTPSATSTAAPTPVAPTPGPATPSPVVTASPAPPSVHQLIFAYDPYGDPNHLKAMQQAASGFMHGHPGTLVTFEQAAAGNSFPLAALLEAGDSDLAEYVDGFIQQHLASKGLISPMDEVWAGVKSNYPEAFDRVVRYPDGHVYGLPTYASPWGFFYRKSVWSKHGYVPPQTWTELLALCRRMKADGLVPVAFGDKDGWPALATFDYLNLRLNGYDFHERLLSGKERWTDARVTQVFERWRDLLPYCQAGAVARVWQDAAAGVLQGVAGMYLFDTWLTEEIEKRGYPPGTLADIDVFAFPAFGNEFDAENAVEAPFKTMIMCARSKRLEAVRTTAEAYLGYSAQGSTQLLVYQLNSRDLPAASNANLSGMPDVHRKTVELLRGAKRITRFMDRDTRADFTGAGGMQGFVIMFLRDPAQDLQKLQQSIQFMWDGLPPFRL